ncbi:MAG: DivIVA domain-containing protein, partial [Calditrichaeota bacterium]
MKLTPLDIRKQEFKKTWRGFDPVEVQTFLEMVGEEYEQILEKNKLLSNRLIELETKLKDFQENEKNLRETLFNVQEVKKQSEESSRKQADLLIKEAELKALEIIEMARKQARQMRDEVSMLRTQKESFINRLRQILISQIELLSVLEIDDALPEEAYKFLENSRSRKKIAASAREESAQRKNAEEDEPIDIEFDEGHGKPPPKEEKQETVKSSGPDADKMPEEDSSKGEEKKEEAEEIDISKKVDDEINEFFKK